MLDLSSYRVILASNSPRRKELLAGLNIKYEIITLPNIDESYPDSLRGEEIPLFISKKKSVAYRDYIEDDTLLITADTIVLLDGKVYGKPIDENDAKRMLHDLSGNTHTVITAVSVCTKTKEHSFTVSSEVRFAKLDSDDIDYYVSTYKPLDKAGAYGIQEWIGYIAVEYISGSYFNIMGLPVQRLYKELKNFCL